MHLNWNRHCMIYRKSEAREQDIEGDRSNNKFKISCKADTSCYIFYSLLPQYWWLVDDVVQARRMEHTSSDFSIRINHSRGTVNNCDFSVRLVVDRSKISCPSTSASTLWWRRRRRRRWISFYSTLFFTKIPKIKMTSFLRMDAEDTLLALPLHKYIITANWLELQ